MVRKYLNIIFVLFIFSSIANAQNIKAVAKVDSSNYQIGDYINLTININYDDGIRVYSPSLPDSLLGIETISGPTLTTENSNGKNSGEITVTPPIRPSN